MGSLLLLICINVFFKAFKTTKPKLFAEDTIFDKTKNIFLTGQKVFRKSSSFKQTISWYQCQKQPTFPAFMSEMNDEKSNAPNREFLSIYFPISYLKMSNETLHRSKKQPLSYCRSIKEILHSFVSIPCKPLKTKLIAMPSKNQRNARKFQFGLVTHLIEYKT